MKIFDRVVEVLGKPISVSTVLAVFVSSLLVLLANFIPVKYLKMLHVDGYLFKYNYIFLLVCLVSLILILIYIFFGFFEFVQKKRFAKYVSKQQDKLFKDADAFDILNCLYSNHPRAVHLYQNNQKVRLLEYFNLITKVNSFTVSDPNDPEFAYILQPIAEDRLKKLHSAD